MGKRYYLKWGFIAIGTYIIGSVVAALVMSGFDMGWFFYILTFIIVFPYGDSLNSISQFLLAFALILTFCFIIGVFAGYVYRKSKTFPLPKE